LSDYCRLRQRSLPSRCVDIDNTKLMISDASMSAKSLFVYSPLA